MNQGMMSIMNWIAVGMLLVLNLIDALLTLHFVRLGQAVELNPLWSTMVLDSPLLFMGLKMSIIAGASWILLATFKHRPHLTLLTSASCVMIYIVICTWHAIGSGSLG